MALFGIDQNGRILAAMIDSGRVSLLDVVFLSGNTLIWIVVGLLLSWRIPASLSLVASAAACRSTSIASRPCAPCAHLHQRSADHMGALGLSTLQSPSAQIRIDNYAPSFVVGGISGMLLFLLPLWGVRANIIERKARRVAEIDAALADVPSEDLQQLELLHAHRDRVRQISNWPIDLQIVTRIFAA